MPGQRVQTEVHAYPNRYCIKSFLKTIAPRTQKCDEARSDQLRTTRCLCPRRPEETEQRPDSPPWPEA